MSTNVVRPALTPRATPVSADNLAHLHVLEAYIETLKAENEILKRRLAAAEAALETCEGGRGDQGVPRPSRSGSQSWRLSVLGPGGGDLPP
jgi:hypothetical protein